MKECYILHSRPFSNSSLIVDVFSQSEGRLALVARSARGPKSRFKGLLQPFSPLLLEWAGKRELKYLSKLEWQASPKRLQGNALLCGFYLNELLVKALQPHDPHPEVFVAYEVALTRLAQADECEPVLRIFERHLLEACGYGLGLVRCEPGAHYGFYPEQGLVKLPQASEMSFPGDLLQQVAQQRFGDASVLQMAKRLMRLAIHELVGGREIKTRQMLR